jgi:hypothetical protein
VGGGVPGIHPGQRGVADWRTTQTGASADAFQFAVGDHHRQFEDAVALRPESGHLEVEPEVPAGWRGREQVVEDAMAEGHGGVDSGVRYAGGAERWRGGRPAAPAGARWQGRRDELSHRRRGRTAAAVARSQPCLLSSMLSTLDTSLATQTFILFVASVTLARLWLARRQIATRRRAP